MSLRPCWCGNDHPDALMEDEVVEFKSDQTLANADAQTLANADKVDVQTPANADDEGCCC